jgi:hypothetical protein
MKKLLLGLALALSTVSFSEAQTAPQPRKKLATTQTQAGDSVITKVPNPGSTTHYPLPEYNPWPWEYQLPRLFL